jgi:hypothetical protein
MRFLKIGPDDELSLTHDFSNNFPEYAILSHTWGQQGEDVTFEDWMSGRAREKKGYEKLIFCAKQAKVDGLEHFWIDTCCI